VSAFTASQLTQAAPLTPHAANVFGVQVGPLQQPAGQAAALQPAQTPLVQLWAPQL